MLIKSNVLMTFINQNEKKKFKKNEIKKCKKKTFYQRKR